MAMSLLGFEHGYPSLKVVTLPAELTVQDKLIIKMCLDDGGRGVACQLFNSTTGRSAVQISATAGNYLLSFCK